MRKETLSESPYLEFLQKPIPPANIQIVIPTSSSKAYVLDLTVDHYTINEESGVICKQISPTNGYNREFHRMTAYFSLLKPILTFLTGYLKMKRYRSRKQNLYDLKIK